jgi:hypothetical protein
MSGIVDDLRSSVNDILGLRDSLGVGLKKVYLVTRTWSGSELGEGTKTVTKKQLLPSPRVVEFMDEFKIKDGGAVQQGDLLLKMISKQSYPLRSDIDCTTSSENVEKFYEVGGTLYRVIMVREKHVVWDVQLRRDSKQ